MLEQGIVAREQLVRVGPWSIYGSGFRRVLLDIYQQTGTTQRSKSHRIQAYLWLGLAQNARSGGFTGVLRRVFTPLRRAVTGAHGHEFMGRAAKLQLVSSSSEPAQDRFMAPELGKNAPRSAAKWLDL